MYQGNIQNITRDEAISKVLIVDDEPNIVMAVDFLMKKQGFKTQKAYNGERALELIETHAPDIVILDVMMPGMNGFEVARSIRSNPKNSEIRIIFLTAKGTDQDKIIGYSKGGDFYLTKPFDNHHLIEMVTEILEFG